MCVAGTSSDGHGLAWPESPGFGLACAGFGLLDGQARPKANRSLSQAESQGSSQGFPSCSIQSVWASMYVLKVEGIYSDPCSRVVTLINVNIAQKTSHETRRKGRPETLSTFHGPVYK